MEIFKLSKNEVLFGEQGTMSHIIAEAAAPMYELNQKLIMRRVRRLQKEIDNKDAILRYTWRQYRLALRSGCTPEERRARYDRLREVMEVYSTKEDHKQLGALVRLLE